MRKLITVIILSVFLISLCSFLIACKKKETEPKFTSIGNFDGIQKIEVLNYNREKIKTISSEEEINEIILIISKLKKENGTVNSDWNTWFLLMYNESNNLIYEVKVWDEGYMGFSEEVIKEYGMSENDIINLKKIIEK